MFAPRLRFGAFIAPFHPVDENPTLAIQRDLDPKLRELAYLKTTQLNNCSY